MTFRGLNLRRLAPILFLLLAVSHGRAETFLSLPSSTTPRLRIVPLGDSITQGHASRFSYRYPLWKKLLDVGLDFDFVGTQISNEVINPYFPPYLGQEFDLHQEGHAFYQTIEIFGQLPHWMSGSDRPYVPDVALLHIGTNDCLLAIPAATAASNIRGIIDVLRARNPRVAVLLAKIVPINSGDQELRVLALNALMAGVAADKTTADSPVIVVDQHTGFDAVADHMSDGVHPNASGDEKLAQKWFEALQLLTARSNVGHGADGRLTITFRRLKVRTALSYVVEVSSNLVQWQSGPAETEEIEVLDSGTATEWVTVRDRNLPGATTRYIRLRLNYAP